MVTVFLLNTAQLLKSGALEVYSTWGLIRWHLTVAHSDTKVFTQQQHVDANTLSCVDLDQLAAEGKDNAMIDFH